MDDDWEVSYFGDLSHDGTGDTDRDGVSDLEEYRAGTNPINSDSILLATVVTSLGDGAVWVAWPAVPGKTYQVQFKNSLGETDWSDLGDPQVAAGPVARAQDAAVTSLIQRYYRVQLIDPNL